MDDLKMIDKTKEELQIRYKQLEKSVMISIQSLDLASLKSLYARKEN